MICPHCGTHVPDGSAVCPACHAELDATTVLPRVGGSYCPGCGSLLPEGATSCPACGMPVGRREPAGAAGGEGRRLSLPEVDAAPEPADELEETHSMPRIESAIPGESEPAYDRLPRTRVVLLCAAASLALVGGLALALTHPWDPDAYSTRATEARDTSRAGFPGERERLSGQDSTGEDPGDDPISADEATYEELIAAYEELGELDERLGAAESGFEQAAFGGDAQAFSDAAAEAEQLSYDVSNLISDIGEVDVTSGTYAEDAEHLETLGNWLRNRADALNGAWAAAKASPDPASDRDEIMAPLTETQNAYGVSTYKGLFDQNYEAWEPMPPEGDG